MLVYSLCCVADRFSLRRVLDAYVRLQVQGKRKCGLGLRAEFLEEVFMQMVFLRGVYCLGLGPDRKGV